MEVNVDVRTADALTAAIEKLETCFKTLKGLFNKHKLLEKKTQETSVTAAAKFARPDMAVM